MPSGEGVRCCFKIEYNMNDAGKGKVNKHQSTNYTQSNNKFHISKSILVLLLAQPYWIQKVLHKGRSVHIIKLNKQKNKNSQELSFNNDKKKWSGKQDSLHIKVLIMLIKQHKIAIKGRRTLWSRTMLLCFCTWQFFSVQRGGRWGGRSLGLQQQRLLTVVQ